MFNLCTVERIIGNTDLSNQRNGNQELSVHFIALFDVNTNCAQNSYNLLLDYVDT